MATPLDDMIAEIAARRGVPADVLRRFVAVESGGNPNNITGSYKGLLQLSDDEFRKHGGKGSILDPRANLDAGAVKIAAESDMFRRRYGREPSPAEIYMLHQQGWGGLQAHIANPDQPAWQSMAGTLEGRQKGPAWAREAISGNMPKSWGADPSSITSKEFMERWAARFGGAEPPASMQVANQSADASLPVDVKPEDPAEIGGWATSYEKPQDDSPATEAIVGALKAMGKAATAPRPGMVQLATAPAQKNSMAVLGMRAVGTPHQKMKIA